MSGPGPFGVSAFGVLGSRWCDVLSEDFPGLNVGQPSVRKLDVCCLSISVLSHKRGRKGPLSRSLHSLGCPLLLLVFFPFVWEIPDLCLGFLRADLEKDSMVAYNHAVLTCAGLPADLDASGRAGGGANASMSAWISSGVSFSGRSGSLATGMGLTSIDPLFGLPTSGRARSSAFRPLGATWLLVGLCSHPWFGSSRPASGP